MSAESIPTWKIVNRQLRAWRRIAAEVTVGLCDDGAAAINASALALIAPLANPTETEMRIALSFARDAWAVAQASEVFS